MKKHSNFPICKTHFMKLVAILFFLCAIVLIFFISQKNNFKQFAESRNNTPLSQPAASLEREQEKEQIINSYKKTIQSSRYLMHALGGIDGKISYTNSIDALMQSYEKGFRLFETDVRLTTDGVPVLVHDWREVDYKYKIGEEYYKAAQADDDGRYIPTYQEFMNFSIQGNYKATSFSELADFMELHTDMYVMIDIGNQTFSDTQLLYQALIKAASNNSDVLDRLIVGGHTKDMIKAVQATYDFPIYNLYFADEKKRESDWLDPDNFIAYCKDNEILSFSVASNVYTAEIAKQLSQSDLICYVFTINEKNEAEDFLKIGADIIGTDFLR